MVREMRDKPGKFVTSRDERVMMIRAITPDRPRILHLDFLRGFAILYIVGVHHLDDYAGNVYHSQWDVAATKAFLGMFVFISGYLLSMNNPINGKGDLLNFAFKRFLRIYPLYALSLILFSERHFQGC
jgi:peptidoglycan/LPS O-acetylase OafA/YrhL